MGEFKRTNRTTETLDTELRRGQNTERNLIYNADMRIHTGEVEIEMLSTWKRGSGEGPFIGADNTMTDLEYVENSTGI